MKARSKCCGARINRTFPAEYGFWYCSKCFGTIDPEEIVRQLEKLLPKKKDRKLKAG